MAINRAYSLGLIIVAAGNNSNVCSYPAFFSNVIGVRCSKIPLDINYNFKQNPLYGLDIEVNSHLDIFCPHKGIPGAFPSNSFAAPYITALIAKYMDQSKLSSIEDIRLYLSNNINNYNSNIYHHIDWINNAVVYNILSDGYISSNLSPQYCFHVTEEYTIITNTLSSALIEIKEKINNIESTTDTVVINSNLNPSNKNLLELNSINYYLHNIAKNTVILIKGISEKIAYGKMYANCQYLSFPKNLCYKKEVSIPLIICIGDKIQMLYTLQFLSNKFKENGYNAGASISYSSSILYGLWPLKLTKNTLSEINYISDKFLYDIFLFGISDNYTLDLTESILSCCDIILYDSIEHLKNSYICEKYKSKIYLVNSNLDSCYNEICSLLS